MRNIPQVAPKGTAWFLNEDGVPYNYDADKQEADFPGDFHEAYATEEAAWAASEELEDADEPNDDESIRLLDKALDYAVANDVLTDSEADHLHMQYAIHVNGDC